ncbi:anti-sigma factor RsiW [Litoreibacter ponti]|uniref:Anti-sigma factor RsiW n=1 Tax=Litoreibacter ponti TaxID=1510457 RepID=A0A2T6BIH4_9RHOB|nr:hypothetical protein [Litoreibacter ponti]PTX55857.1 anti-sigma factor RsiW [Litoreibacter ponti]
MSPSDTDISDETLTAYLNGALSQPEADMVADALIDSPALAARLSALEVPISELRPALSQMLEEMPPGVLPPSHDRSTQGRRGGLIMAGFALLLGLGIGAFAIPRPPPGWHDDVARIQALYVADTLRVTDQTPEATADQLALVAARLGRSLAPATDVPGLAFKRAQIMGFRGQALAQLAYLAEDETPIALYVLKSAEKAALTTTRLEGLDAASWSDGAYAFLLIGGTDPARIKAAALHVQAAL